MIEATEADELACRFLRFAFSTARKCCPRHLEDEADSVALVGLAQALQNWPGWDMVSFPTWAGRIVKRRAWELLRTEGRDRPPGRGEFPIDDVDGLVVDPVDFALTAAAALTFDDLIAPLSPADRRLFRRVFVEDHDVAGACKVDGLSKTDGHRRYHAALAKLRTGMLDTASPARPVSGSTGRVGVKAP